MGLGNPLRFMGDPVDVVSGANIDISFEFRLEGPLPFEWRRYYDSSKNLKRSPLGWGHTHEFDRWLLFDVDGMRYIGPEGDLVFFPFLLKDGEQVSRNGFTLKRISTSCYHIDRHQHPIMEFVFETPDCPAPIRRLFKGSSSIHFQYGSNGFLNQVTDSLRRQIHVETDENGHIRGLFLVEPEGQEIRKISLITYHYDEAGHLVQGIDAYRNPFRFTYDQDHRMISKTDRRGYTFFYEYDKEGRCVHSYGQDGLHEVRLKFLTQEGMTIVTKADGGEWFYFYDQNGALTQILDPYGGTKLFHLDGQGRVVEETDPNGNGIRWIYGPAGDVVGKINLFGQFSPISEEEPTSGSPPHRIPATPLEWEYGDLIHRSLFSRPKLKIDPKALQADPEEAATGGAQISPKPQIFDRLGLLVKELGPQNTFRRWTYDPNRNIQRYIDRDGSVYRFEYTSWNLLENIIDPLGRRISYTYNASESITSFTDPGGTRSEYRYDLKDRLVEIYRHGTLKERYHYDLADNLIEKRDGQGNLLLTFDIGPGNLKTARHLASGENHYFAYDSFGRFREVRTDDHVILFEYDEWGNRVRDERDGRGVRHRFHRRGLAQTTVFERFVVKYSHQDDGSLQIEDPGGHVHTLQVMRNGLVSRTMSNGTKEVSLFDYEGRCLEKTLERRSDRNFRWKREFIYSGEGDLLTIRDTFKGDHRYEYDQAHRLIRSIYLDGRVDSYEYDMSDNLLKKPGLGGVSLREGNRISTANGDRFEYNHRNAISLREKGGRKVQYHYDARDFLKAIDIDGERVWEAGYDPLGRRIWKQFGSKKTEFYWDRDRLIAELREDGSFRLYIYADAFSIVPLLFMEYGSMGADPSWGKRFFIFCNHIGTPILVEDDSGKTVWSAILEPYGMAQIERGSEIDLPLRFPGHYADPEIGLHYNRFRYYSPELGRYWQPDPAGIEDHFNLYIYSTRPTVEVDVRGLGCGGDPPKPPKRGEDGPDFETVGDVRQIPISSRKGTQPFSDVPPFRNKNIDEIRQILYSLGFRRRQTERTVDVLISDDPDIPIYVERTDSQGGSEIWMRRDDNGNYEAVRIDPHGHHPPPGSTDFKGGPPHCHREYIPNDQARRDSAVNPKTGQNVFSPGTSADDAANRYADGWTPGIYDTYDDNNNPTKLNDFDANHTPISVSSW